MKALLNGEERDIDIKSVDLDLIKSYNKEIEKELQLMVTKELDKKILAHLRGEDYVPRD